VIMLSSQAMAQSPTNENVTKDAKSDNDNKTSKSENATSNVPSCILEPKDSKAGIVKDSFAVAGLVAVIIILAVTFASSRIIRKGRQWLRAQGQLVLESNCKQGNHKGGFWDIIREADYYPSLARLQFVLWTFTISFTLLSIYLFMLWNHTLCWSDIPQNILALMGISAGVPVVSTVISKEKYMSSISGTLPCKENVPALSTMLLEHSKPTLGRYQLFIWTIISIIVYLGIFFAQVDGISTQGALAGMKLADIPLPLLALMTTSQGAYLGLKAIARPVSFLTKVGSVPAPNQQNIKKSTDVVVSFSDSLDSAAVNNLNFLVRKHSDTTDVPGTVTVLAEDDKMAVFHPNAELEADTAYDVHILTSIQSKDKNRLEFDETWSFKTGP
jgi:Big-like domain-containing protein